MATAVLIPAYNPDAGLVSLVRKLSATGRFSDKANAVGLFVQEGIDQLEKRQLGTGEFSLWPGGGSAGSYVTLYASHVLLEAKAQGYDVNPIVYNRIVSYMNRSGSAPAV